MSPKYISDMNGPICEPFHGPSNFRHHILVVEDERDFRQLTAEVLIDAGYQVEVAEDGAAAWSTLQLSKCDLLIADQFMPWRSAVKLLKKIHAARMPLPVIMATGFLPTGEIMLHTWLQPVKMLLKPYSFEKLLSSVKNILQTPLSAGDDIPLPTVATEHPIAQRGSGS
jgi:two-component system OmpR family response regulator